ncbi:hypothetical protein DER44DRAFT_751572 [Fusarium oxysporum]|nr:hypothetical protein DER44DRAFT_751572 [Fusarium oxysporum]
MIPGAYTRGICLRLVMLCLFNVKEARSFIEDLFAAMLKSYTSYKYPRTDLANRLKAEEGGKDVDNAAKVGGLECNRAPKSAKLRDHEFTANGAFALGEEITLFKGKMDMAQTKTTTARACA